MKVKTKQTLFDVPHPDGKKKPVNEGSEIEVDDATGTAMIGAGQATEVKASKRPAKDTASKRAKSRETR